MSFKYLFFIQWYKHIKWVAVQLNSVRFDIHICAWFCIIVLTSHVSDRGHHWHGRPSPLSARIPGSNLLPPKSHQPHQSMDVKTFEFNCSYAQTYEDFVRKTTWSIMINQFFSHERVYLNDLCKQDNERSGSWEFWGSVMWSTQLNTVYVSKKNISEYHNARQHLPALMISLQTCRMDEQQKDVSEPPHSTAVSTTRTVTMVKSTTPRRILPASCQRSDAGTSVASSTSAFTTLTSFSRRPTQQNEDRSAHVSA